MKISLKKLFIAIGYSETTWKAARTRAVGDNKVEELEEKEAITLIMKIASSKITKANTDKVVNAQKILGGKKWKNFAVDAKEVEVVEIKKECECEELKKRIKELENEVGALNMMIRFLEGGKDE